MSEQPNHGRRGARPGYYLAVWALCAAGLVWGCAEADSSVPPLPAPDFEEFALELQPIVTARCGNPSSCHGDPSRPWVIFASGMHRLVPADVFLDPPLSEAELRANYQRTLGFVVGGRADLSELLRKPLAPSDGGSHHEGGTIFADRRDREYQVIAAWIDGGMTWTAEEVQ